MLHGIGKLTVGGERKIVLVSQPLLIPNALAQETGEAVIDSAEALHHTSTEDPATGLHQVLIFTHLLLST